MFLQERHSANRRELDKTDDWFRTRFFLILSAGPLTFVSLLTFVAGTTLKKCEGPNGDPDIFRLVDGLSTRAGQAAWLMLAFVVIVLLIWTFAVRNYYQACPTHSTMPKARTVFTLLTVVVVFFLGMLAIVVDPLW